MAYSNFKLAQVLQKFELVTDSTVDLFPNITPITPSDLLKNTLEQNVPLARQIATEKARSEFIIAPILSEVWQRNKPNVGFFSGVEFTVEESQGLKGTCDFLFTRAKEQSVIVAPVLAVVEAKKEDLKPGMGQCIAEMVAARIFNARESGKGKEIAVPPATYGVVTTGTNWQFLKLDGQTVYIDREERYLNGASNILGILFSIVSGKG
jgi:hypothetical protein